MADQFNLIKTEGQWEDFIIRKAVDAARAKMVQMQTRHNVVYPDPEKALNSYVDDFARRLKAKFPFSSYENEPRMQSQVAEWKTDDVLRYLSYGDTQDGQKVYDPHNIHNFKAYKNLRSILWDNPENGVSWRDMSPDVLKETAAQLGYDPYTDEGYKNFMADLTMAQNLQTRSGIMADLQDQWWYLPTSIVYPSMMEEAENQIMTGKGEDWDLAKLGVLDAGANLLAFNAPGYNGFSTPKRTVTKGYNAAANFVNKLNPATHLPGTLAPEIGAVLEQGAAEAGRQYGKTLVDDRLEPDNGMILGTVGASLTRPALLGIGSFGQGTGAVKDFQRGLQKASIVGDPVLAERAELQGAYPYFDKYRQELVGIEGFFNAHPDVPVKGNLRQQRRGWMTLAEEAERDQASKVTNLLKAFGIDPTKPGSDASVQFSKATLDDVMNIYDYQMGNKIFSPEQRNLLGMAAPMKKADIKNKAVGSKGAYYAGLGVGNLLGEAGSRIEPTFHVTPSDFDRSKLDDKRWFADLGVVPEGQDIVKERMQLQQENVKKNLYKDWSEGRNIPPPDSTLYQEYLAFMQTQQPTPLLQFGVQ